METTPIGLTLSGLSHHKLSVEEDTMHYVAAGTYGSPILLVHGFPETWWTFHKLIPLLAERHRVFAVDLRGFGDSSNGSGGYDSRTAAADLYLLIQHLNLGPVHLTGQDFNGAAIYRLVTSHPESIASLTAIEMGLPGFGLEALADITHGGSWHIGMLTAPDVPAMLLRDREHAFIVHLFSSLSVDKSAISADDIAEFVRSYSRSNGWCGAIGLYRSILAEGAEIRKISADKPLSLPVLAVSARGGAFTFETMKQTGATDVRSVLIEGVGHYLALENPVALASAILEFIQPVDAGVAID